MTNETLALEKNDLKELLNKCWMTHDAMWFYNCLEECGIEKTNKINQAAIRALGPIEIKRIQKALGTDGIDTFEEFKRFFNLVMEIVSGKFMKFDFSFPGKNLIHAEWRSCFAYEGMKGLGVADRYECGIMLRIEVWFDTLGIKYEVEPKVTGCMMHTEGQCFRDYRFFFEK
ncbi:MAG: hypothetical protein HY787_27385 [Deltaproteobacteria bacterium]|nr:hypothetical protein [Deltaproteobacteria bacterium]